MNNKNKRQVTSDGLRVEGVLTFKVLNVDFTTYRNNYKGKEEFVKFIDKMIDVLDVSHATRKLFLIKKEDLYCQYRQFCIQKGGCVGSKINIGRHLAYHGVQGNSFLGSHGCQKRAFSGIRWKNSQGKNYHKNSEVKKHLINNIKKDRLISPKRVRFTVNGISVPSLKHVKVIPTSTVYSHQRRVINVCDHENVHDQENVRDQENV